LDTQAQHNFADIIRQATEIFTEVTYTLDKTPERAILRLQATYGAYRVFITELVDQETRKYRYYVLKGEKVKAGFDNSPDPRALRLKYGRIGVKHAGEEIPHFHRNNKTHLELTEEMTVKTFVDWIRQNLPEETKKKQP
jgi:tRNA nucleotidyltransferase/poly(A) polymerase